MPKICLNDSQPTLFNFWPDEATSQNFQLEVLSMLQAEYGIDLAIAKEIHAEYAERRKTARKLSLKDHKT